MTGRRHVAVAGAGIGGLAAAIALARIGCSVTVCERADTLSEIGAGIQLAPNAGKALNLLGLAEEIGRAATEPKSIELRDAANAWFRQSIPAEVFRATYGAPYRVIHRADLQRVLLEAARGAGIEIRLGAEVTDIGLGDLGVTVTARTGDDETNIQAAALVAADGVWSRQRLALRSGGRAIPLGRSVWRAMASQEDAGAHITPDTVGLWLAPHAHMVHYPVANGVNIVAITDEKLDDHGWEREDDGSGLRIRATGWPASIRKLMDLPRTWRKFSAATVDPTGPWTSGRVALLGDAAHAMAPFLAQGAAMALEDAVVLAACVARSDDVAAAFRAYEAERKPRVVRMARQSLRAGSIYGYTGGLAAVRDLTLTLGGARFVVKRNDWIYDWRPPGGG